VPRRIPIRIKLAAALAIPITALLLVSVLEVAQSAKAADKVEEQTELATASIGPGGLISALQNERNYGALWLLGQEAAIELPVTSYQQAKDELDTSIANFKDEMARRGGTVQATYADAVDDVEKGIVKLREMVDTYKGPRGLNNIDNSEPYYTGYIDLVNEMFKANGQVALAIDDSTLRRGVELTDLATHEIETVGLMIRRALLSAVDPKGDGMLADAAEIGEMSGLNGQFKDDLASMQQLAIGPYAAPAKKAFDDLERSRFAELTEQILRDAAKKAPPITEYNASVSRKPGEGMAGFRERVNTLLNERAAALNDEAARSQKLYLALAGLAILVAFLVTWLVSRSITRPLRSLTRQAKEMAERRLPEAVIDILETPLGEDVSVPGVDPIRVNTRDEVSDVADALNTVQDSALDLAVEQAVLRRNIADSFVNLGRRNQNLLGRQLDFITDLESNETDADTLANLFRLDHLATRMRRNAESLLVLAGIEPPRQWAAPVRLTDVIRAALGEVEDYQRVTVRGVEPATILGSAAADLAHLLAELIENALVFSPPDQTVDIRGRARPDGYTLAIIDSGLGMPPPDVSAANRRLAGTESFTIAPSKYLGHYVAGNLAARHGIAVHLDNSPGNGITATIDLPPALLTSDNELLADPISPPHGTRAVGAGAGGNGARGPAPAPGLMPPGGAPTMPVPAAAGPAPGASPWSGLEMPPQGPPPSDLPMRTAARAPEPPTEPTRTASGLVKRARRSGDGASASMPDGDLLANLTNVANNLGVRPGDTGPVELPRTAEPAPPAPLWSALATNPPTPVTRPPTNRSWPAPSPLVMPPASTPGADSAPPPGPPAAPGSFPPAGDDAQTVSGLTRRVRGAQMPTTQPLSVRRGQDHSSSAPADYGRGDHSTGPGRSASLGNGNGNGNGSTNGHGGARDHDESSTARSVYAFLTSFTQGVQRGLDETRRDPNTPKENS
jgi:signal transduction histidine kinase